MFSFLKKPELNKVTLASEARTLLVARDKTLLEAMLAEGLAMPHDCKVGSCGTCKFKLVDGRIRELSPSALALERDDLSAGYRLACQALPRSDLTGQYADLSAPGIDGPRSYSFAFAPKAGPARQLQFHVRHVPGGTFTDWLFGGERIGTQLMVSAPYGEFHLKTSTAPMLCIAGGSGLAPIMAILQEALANGANRPVVLLYGARSQAHLYCLDGIGELKAAWNGPFEFRPVLSEEAPDSAWDGARGLVTQQIAGLLDKALCEAYLCGPPAMVALAEEELLKAGVSRDTISADRFLDRSSAR